MNKHRARKALQTGIPLAELEQASRHSTKGAWATDKGAHKRMSVCLCLCLCLY